MKKYSPYFIVTVLSLSSLGAMPTPDSSAKTVIIKKTYLDNENEISLSKVRDEILEKTSTGECESKTALLAFDIDNTVLTGRGPQVNEIRNSADVLKTLQAHGIQTLAVTARSVVDTFSHDPTSLKTIEGIRNGDMADEGFRKQELYRKVEEVWDDFHHAGNINPTPGATAFRSSTAFYDAAGNATSQGFFTFDGAEFPQIMKTKSIKETAQIMHYGAGVLMVSGHPKGEALKKFFARENLTDHFKCIFFVDDTPKNIKAVTSGFENTEGMKVFLYKVPAYSRH